MFSPGKNLGIILCGNVLEYFQLTLYAAFAPIIISEVLPPQGSQITEMFIAFGGISLMFIIRPLGSVLFGYIGDQYGRSTSLMLSIFGMAVATLSIGIAPQYDNYGAGAYLFLCSCLCIQGLCVGGEGQGAAVYALERFQNYRTSTIGAIVNGSSLIGAISAIFVAWLFYTLDISHAHWRMLFIFSGIFGICLGVLRKYLKEPHHDNADNKKIALPVVAVFRDYPRQMLITILLSGLSSALIQCVVTFFNIFHIEYLGLSYNLSTLMGILGVGAALFSILWIAFIVKTENSLDSLQKSLWQSLYVIPAGLLIMPVFPENFRFMTVIIIGVFAGKIAAHLYGNITFLFPRSVRYTGVCVASNIGIGFLGGTFPLISAYSLKQFDNLLIAAAYYLLLGKITYDVIKKYSDLMVRFEGTPLQEKVA